VHHLPLTELAALFAASLEAAKEAQPAVGKVDPTPEGSEVLSKGKEGPGGMLADVEGAVSSAIDFAKEKTADLTTQTDKVHTSILGELYEMLCSEI